MFVEIPVEMLYFNRNIFICYELERGLLLWMKKCRYGENHF